MRKARLGVNIDHVATIRQARNTIYPSLIKAAEESIQAGADQITIHLRSDRRHIQDQDVPALVNFCHSKNSFLNLEICCDPNIVNQAVYYRPDWVCLVPERIEEKTTEGGLNLKDPKVFTAVEKAINHFLKFSPKSKISLFIAADTQIIPYIKRLPVNAIEIHTGDYAHAYPHYHQELEKIKNFYHEIAAENIHIHAGHGLTQESLIPLLEMAFIEEYNIGHWIIADSIFKGIHNVVFDLKNLIERFPLKIHKELSHK